MFVTRETWNGYGPDDRQYHRIIAGLFAAGFATFAQLYSSQSLLPQITRTEHISADRAALSISMATAGLGLSVLMWAELADRYGRVKVMEYSAVAAALIGLVTPYAPNWQLLLILRFVEGVALGALPALSVAYLAEEIKPAYVAVAAGMFVSGNSIGGMSGRIVSGAIGEALGWQSGMFAVACLSVIAATLFVITVPVSRGFTPIRERKARGEYVIPWAKRARANVTNRRLWIVYMLGFCVMGCFVSMYSYLTYRLEHAPFNVPTTLVSFLFVTYIVGTFSSRQSGRLVPKFGALPVLSVAIALMIIGAQLTRVPNVWVVLAGLVAFTFGYFAASPVMSAMTAKYATIGRAQASALYQFAYYAGASFLGWWMGRIFVRQGWTWTTTAMCIILVAAGVTAWLVLGPRRHSAR